MPDIHELYGDVVQYTKRLENIIKEQTLLDDEFLRSIRNQYLKPVVNVVKDWEEKAPTYHSDNISMETIPYIEQALGFKLHEHQVKYLTGTGLLYGGRGSGKTTAYCIRLALSKGKPLNLRRPEEFADGLELSGRLTYSRHFFKPEFMLIRNKLQKHGFTVRDIAGGESN